MQTERKKRYFKDFPSSSCRDDSALEPILDIGGMDAFFEACFIEKRAFYLLASPKQMSFLPFLLKIFCPKLSALDCVQQSHPT